MQKVVGSNPISRFLRCFVLTLVCLGVITALPSLAAGQTYFHGCGNKNQIEPEEIVLTCGDGKLRVEELDWTRWEGTRALARGFLVYPDCPARVPLYRCQNYAHDPVKFKLFQPDYCPRFRVRYFVQGAVIDESAPTPATRFSPFKFDCPKTRAQRKYWRKCGDQHVRGAKWFDVKAHNVRCRKARGIAHAYVWKGDRSPGGFSCESFGTGYETSRVACYRERTRGRGQKVRFSFGA